MERSDELHAQAVDATLSIFMEHNDGNVDADAMRLMRLAWFAGYGAGIDRTSELADKAFAEMKAAL